MNDSRCSLIRGTNESFEVVAHDREVFNTHWVSSPAVRRRGGEVLFDLRHTQWSLDTGEWHGDVVAMTMRKYPGHHVPGDIEVAVDCAGRVGMVNGARFPLDTLEAAMDAALHWLSEDEQRALQAARRPPPRKPWWKFW